MSDRPTPLTDAFMLTAASGYPRQCCDFARSLERQLAEANEWKKSALQVESSWDCQRVGKLLNLPLGSDIRAGIEPGIRELQTKLAEAKEAKEKALKLLHEARRDYSGTMSLYAYERIQEAIHHLTP